MAGRGCLATPCLAALHIGPIPGRQPAVGTVFWAATHGNLPKELETIVARLEKGDVELEDSIAIYERGEALREHCDRLLKQAEAKVEKLTLNSQGVPEGTAKLE